MTFPTPLLAGALDLARRLLRSPVAFWVVAAALATATATTAAGFVEESRAAAESYGPLRDLVVATRPVGVGAVVTADQVALRQVPQAALPDGHLSDPADAVGRTVVVPLLTGLAVVAGNLAPEGSGGVGALLPPGRRAVAVPLDVATPPLRPGDHVDVLVTYDVSVRATVGSPEGGAATSLVLARAVPVLDVSGGEDPGGRGAEAVTVSVSAPEAARIAFAVTQGVVTLSLTAPLSPQCQASLTPCPTAQAAGADVSEGRTGRAPRPRARSGR